MWILFALGSAFFAGLTAVLAKCGIEHTNSHLATCITYNCGTCLLMDYGRNSWIILFY